MQHDDPSVCHLANQRMLYQFAWIMTACLVFALAMPQPLFAASMCSMTGFGSGIHAMVALLSGARTDEPYFTMWDSAAAFYALSLFFGFFVDVEQVQLFLQHQ